LHPLPGSLCLVAWLAVACVGPWPPPRERAYFAHTLDPDRLPGATLPLPLLERSRTMRVHAYADAAFRTQNPNWRRRIRTLFAEASTWTQRQFGARFEVTALREWPQTSAPQPSLVHALVALEQMVPMDDAEWVGGFVGATAAHAPEEPGLTHRTGHHIVLRAAPEPSANADTAAGQRQDAALWLRLWGRSLGGPPTGLPDPAAPQPAGAGDLAFSAPAARIIAIGLDFHQYRSPEARRTWASVVQDAAQRNPTDTDAPVWRAALEWAEAVLQDGQPQQPRAMPGGPATSSLQLL